jgi:branched-chain amino acid transport system substrate-binding protein
MDENLLFPTGIGRRRFLAGSATLAATAIASLYIGRAGAAEPIKIGMIWAKTGQITQQAEYLAQGSMLALEQRSTIALPAPFSPLA